MSKKILLIDDNVSLVRLICLILQQSGFEVMIAHNGEAGIETALAEKPDLIVLDIMMPDMSGYDVCRVLRSKSELDRTYIIMFSAMARRKDREAGLEAGADDYLIKPIHPVELIKKVQTILVKPRIAPKMPVLPPMSPISTRSYQTVIPVKK